MEFHWWVAGLGLPRLVFGIHMIEMTSSASKLLNLFQCSPLLCDLDSNIPIVFRPVRGMEDLPVGITSSSSVPRRMRLPSEDREDPDYRPSSRGSSSRPNSPLPSGDKPQKTKVTTLKYTVDNPSSCKISDNLSDSCKTHCKICGEAFFLGYMRTHVPDPQVSWNSDH